MSGASHDARISGCWNHLREKREGKMWPQGECFTSLVAPFSQAFSHPQCALSVARSCEVFDGQRSSRRRFLFKMHGRRAVLLLAALQLLRAAAYEWVDVEPFPCPRIINNRCTRSQRHGYDFKGLSDGTFSTYGDSLFSGFVVSHDNSSHRNGSVDPAAPRHYIVGSLKDSPSIFAAQDETFSLERLHIDSTCDSEINLIHHVADGTTCTELHASGPGRSTIRNTQCGGESCMTVGSHLPVSLPPPMWRRG